MTHPWLSMLLIATTASAHAQSVSPPADSATTAAVDRIVARASADGLPADAVRAKAREGISRGVPGDRVVAVVSAYADALREARALLGDEPPIRQDLVATAGALTAGVSRPAATTLASAAHARPGARTVTVPFVVTGDLVARGVPPDSAAAAVRTALQHGASDAELWRLREAIAHDIADGAPPLEAAMLRTGSTPPASTHPQPHPTSPPVTGVPPTPP